MSPLPVWVGSRCLGHCVHGAPIAPRTCMSSVAFSGLRGASSTAIWNISSDAAALACT
eukprot:COSAG01_NODE_48_length_31904_cov_21.696997_21_plen_58_part_00